MSDIFFKTFSTKANATRGAKRAGLTTFGVEQDERDGKIIWMIVDLADAVEETEVLGEQEVLEIDEKQNDDVVAEPVLEIDPERRLRHITNFSDSSGHLRASVIRKGAVERVHAVCREAFDPDENRMTRTRAELMADCQALGIAFYTARTQIQKWAKMTKTTFPKRNKETGELEGGFDA